MARCVSGSENPKNRGPEMRWPVRCAMHTSVQGLVGEVPVKTAPVCWSITCAWRVGGWVVTRQRELAAGGDQSMSGYACCSPPLHSPTQYTP